MRRARDVRDQLEGLMERVEIEITSNIGDSLAIRKVSAVSVSLHALYTLVIGGEYSYSAYGSV